MASSHGARPLSRARSPQMDLALPDNRRSHEIPHSTGFSHGGTVRVVLSTRLGGGSACECCYRAAQRSPCGGREGRIGRDLFEDPRSASAAYIESYEDGSG